MGCGDSNGERGGRGEGVYIVVWRGGGVPESSREEERESERGNGNLEA